MLQIKRYCEKGFRYPGIAILAFILFCLLQCHVDEVVQHEKYVSINLNDSLKKYDSVEVLILAEGDTSKVIGKAWSGPLINPAAIPDFRIPDNEIRTLSLQVKGFDSNAILRYDILISKMDGKQVIANRLISVPSLNLLALIPSSGNFTFGFKPQLYEYWLKLAYAESTLTLTPYSENTNVEMSIDGSPVIYGMASNPISLPLGPKIISVVVTADGKSNTYSVNVYRATDPVTTPPDSNISNTEFPQLLALRTSKGLFNPTFTPEQKEYRVSLLYEESTLSVSAVPKSLSTLMSIGSDTLFSSTPSAPIAIPIGERSILIQLMDGIVSGNYSIRTIRSAIPTGNASKDTLYPNKSIAPEYSSFKHQALISLNLAQFGLGSGNTVLDLPILIRLGKENFNFTQAHASGFDIRFSKLNGQALPYEIGRWDAQAQTADIWVKVDSIRTNDLEHRLYMYWGSDTLASDSKPAKVFNDSDGFKGVYHLSEIGLGKLDDYKDATGKYPGRGGFGNGKALPGRVEGVVGFGQDFFFNSIQGTIVLPIAFDPGTNAWTFQAWIKKTGQEEGVVFQKGNSWLYTDQRFHITVKGGYANHIDVNRDGGLAASDIFIADSPFTYVSIIYDGSKLDFYSDGNYRMSRKWTQGTRGNCKAILGSDLQDGSYLGFHGSMDEIWFSSKVRSADWIRLSYETQRPNSNLVQIKPVP
jgi:Domain of unknown function (DUF2341)/Concanavalin A-like lectin/glucanases superfamily/Cadherin-like beta sandwich domain